MKHWRETSEIVERVFALVTAGRRAALATVVRIEGSSYRRPGARFLIEDDGQTLGGVSGGCLEADVREIALGVLRTGVPRLLHYDTGADDSTVWGLGLGCNGSVDIFVQAATEAPALEMLRDVRARLDQASPMTVSTVVDGPDAGRSMVLDGTGGDAPSRLTKDGDRTVFTEVLRPPAMLIVCGAGDDARPLVTFAADAGFAVTVVDHRQAFLTTGRFPLARRLVHLRPDGEVALFARQVARSAGAERGVRGPASDGDGGSGGAKPPGLWIDNRTLVVIKTHSFAHDRDWLRAFLASGASYIGVLGPRPRADEMLAELNASDDRRVFAPVGLNLGADGPEQIAISVVAELLAVLSRQQPGHLREKGEPIHAF